jgi:hypothetical protein
MASIGGIAINLDQDGGAFTLSEECRRDFEYTVNGDTVRLSAGSRAVVVETGELTGCAAEELLARTYASAQQALDVMAILHGRFYNVPSAELKHVLWWAEESGDVTLRLTDCIPATLHFDVSYAVTHADGTEERSDDAPHPAWHESFRYFRYSQATDELYNAYRTGYLALESLLSQYYPRPKGEGDKAWNKRAFLALESRGLDFSQFVSHGSGNSVDDFVAEQYVANRCAQDHAKLGENHFLPAILEDRLRVQSALYQLSRFLQAAISELAGVRPYVGTTTAAGVKSYNDVTSGLRLFVAADSTPERLNDTVISPLGLPVTELSTTYLGAIDSDGYDYGWLGTVAVEHMADPLVAMTAGTVEDLLYCRATVMPIDTTGLTTFEYAQVQYWSSNSGIRRHYPL